MTTIILTPKPYCPPADEPRPCWKRDGQLAVGRDDQDRARCVGCDRHVSRLLQEAELA